jgi:hypothetical protein
MIKAPTSFTQAFSATLSHGDKPINVQEELKKGALLLKNEVESLLSRYGGAFRSPANSDRYMSFNEDTSHTKNFNLSPSFPMSHTFDMRQPNPVDSFSGYTST